MDRTFWHIQYLRFVASLMVVLNHTWQLVPRHGRGDWGQSFWIGAAGVDIFFVISGFIMITITERGTITPLAFALRRIARVAPLYWLMTLVMAVTLAIAPQLFASSRFGWAALIASLAFVPWPHPTQPGAVPMLMVGWTLNYEFMFYAVFTLALAISPARRGAIAAAILLTLAAAGALLRPTGIAAGFYTNPVIIEFVAGMAVGMLAVHRRLPGRAGSAIALALGTLWFVMGVSHPPEGPDPARWFDFGLPAALIVTGAVGLENARLVRHSEALRRLGDASYSLYLVQLFVVGAVGALWGHFGLRAHASDAVLIGFGAGITVLAGWLTYRRIETPLVLHAGALARRAIERAARGPA